MIFRTNAKLPIQNITFKLCLEPAIQPILNPPWEGLPIQVTIYPLRSCHKLKPSFPCFSEKFPHIPVMKELDLSDKKDGFPGNVHE